MLKFPSLSLENLSCLFSHQITVLPPFFIEVGKAWQLIFEQDVLWGVNRGEKASMQFNRAKASSSTRGQPRLHFPKLSGKLSCLPTKRKINLFNVCSCKQLLNSIKHSLKRLTQTTLLPTPVEHKHALCEKRMSTENFLTICKACK